MAGFPLERLGEWPVTAIENTAALVGGKMQSFCAVGCLGCCTDSVALRTGRPIHLTPALLAGVLAVIEEFGQRGVHAVSTVRLNLFSGTNELDNPDCLQLRETLSRYLLRTYGFPLGSVSSDLVFHVSGSGVFRRNLEQLLARPALWDNICFAIDEQIPFQSRAHYEKYLDHLSWVWRTLRPVIRCELGHAIAGRQGAPRLILNMLIPAEGSSFREEHRLLYPGGPARATRFEELAERYIEPFAGDLVVTSTRRPAGHQFTTGIAQLSGTPGSSVYVAAGRYALTGRGHKLIQGGESHSGVASRTVRTKIMPAGAGQFQFKACFTANLGTEDEIEVPAREIPDWFRSLSEWVIDVGNLAAYREADSTSGLNVLSSNTACAGERPPAS